MGLKEIGWEGWWSGLSGSVQESAMDCCEQGNELF